MLSCVRVIRFLALYKNFEFAIERNIAIKKIFGSYNFITFIDRKSSTQRYKSVWMKRVNFESFVCGFTKTIHDDNEMFS